MTASNIGQWVVKNPGWRLLSLGLAVIIWMNVATEPEMSTFVGAPVQFRDPDGDIDVAFRDVEMVQLETRGSSGKLRELANSHPVVTLDFSGVHEPGERTFTISPDQVKLPRGVELIRTTPSEVHFRFVRRTSKR